MRRNAYRAGMSAAAMLGSAAIVLGAAVAGGRDEDLFVRDEDLHTVLFGSLDAGRSAFVSAGVKHTPTGPLDRDGIVILESNGAGTHRERFRGEVNLPATRLTTQASALVGYQWTGAIYLAALAGPDVSHEQLSVSNRLYRVSQPRGGVRAQFELWANPTPDTLVTTTVVGSSVRGSLWARGSAGYRLPGGAFVGPEATLYMTDTYRETRWGAHVTSWRIGLLTLRVSGGWMKADDGHRGSPYVGLSGWIRM